MQRQLLKFFDHCIPLEKQPKYLVNIGCGNGLILKQIFDFICKKTSRGQYLKQYPLMLIGIDNEQDELREAKKVLKKIPHVNILSCTGNDCAEVLSKIIDLSIEDLHMSLHVCFLKEGNPFLSGSVRPDAWGDYWNSYLQKWRDKFSTTPNCLLIVESPNFCGKLIEDVVSSHDDLYSKILNVFSERDLLDAHSFTLLTSDITYFFAKPLTSCSVILNHTGKINYQIRHAEPKDLVLLQSLEELCWKKDLQTPRDILEQRLIRYPDGHFVLQLNDQVVGVIYSQRISDIEALSRDGLNTTNIDILHSANGAVVQLLALNVNPKVQDRGLGDQLLEFMLQRCSLMSDIHSVVAVTRCRDFSKQKNVLHEDYIHQRDKLGQICDPILHLHESHGARIVKPMPGYRPYDIDNQGFGVLVHYDIHNRLKEKQVKNKEMQFSPHQTLSEQTIENILEEAIKDLLGKDRAHYFSKNRTFMEMGLDSIDILKLSELFSSQWHQTIEPMLFFQYNNYQGIVSYFKSQLKKDDIRKNNEKLSEQILSNFNGIAITNNQSIFSYIKSRLKGDDIRKNNKKLSKQISSHSKEIAIIGMACRLPGGIDTPEAFWEFLKQGKSAIGSLPSDRWYWPTGVDPKLTYQGIDKGGFLENIKHFDASFFSISPKEAELMDPQQRILLELSWEALEDAGYSKDALSGSQTGVFVGASGSDYRLLLEQHQVEVEAHMGTGNATSVLANRLSYFYNFHGPSLQIDTACSSSLVAVHEAVQAMQSGQCSLALVGGVNIICHPGNSIMYYKAGMLSKTGLCKTFDSKADGYVRSEGAVVLLLKPKELAIKQGDPIYALIKGSAANHIGHSGGLTVPNPGQQAKLVQQAWQNAGITPDTISYIEAHGTGTSLGDPIEIEGLKEAFAASDHYVATTNSCAIGSSKSNLGHLEAAAGITGLLKVVLILKHQALVPSINFKELNPHINLDGSPFYVVNRYQEWEESLGNPKKDSIRQAGVSSFGSGGMNAHVILQAYPNAISAKPVLSQYPLLFILSATSKNQLVLYAQKILHYLEPSDNEIKQLDLISFVYSLQCRQALEHRVAFIINSVSELREKLKNLVKGKSFIDYYESNIREGKKILQLFDEDDNMKQMFSAWILEGQLAKIAKLWVNGMSFNDWYLLYKEIPPRMNLPTYPFEKEIYWFKENELLKQGYNSSLTHAIHPLLHKNTSHFQQLCFSTIFSGTEYFLRERRLQGQKELPVFACLEMIREAYHQASGALSLAIPLKFKNVIWISPITVATAPVKIKVLLFAEKNDEVFFEIYSENSSDDASGDSMLHCQGRVAPLLKSLKANVTPSELKADFSEAAIDGKMCYDAFRRLNVDYGSCYQVIKNIYVATEQIIAQLVLPSSLVETTDSLKLHPSLLEGALQIAALGWQLQTLGSLHHPLRLWLPFALDELDILANCSESMWVRLRQCETDRLSDNIKKFDIDLYDDNGALCASMKGLSLENRTNDLGYVLRETGKQWLSLVEAWQPVPLPVDTVEWHKRLRIYKEHNILMLSDNAAHYAHLQEVCSRLNHLAGDEVIDWKIKYLPIHDNKPKILDLEKALEIYLTNSTSAQIIFLMLSNTLNGHEGSDELALIFRVLQLLERAASGRGLQLYCCYPEDSTTRSLYREGLAGLFKSVMLEGANHRYRTIAYDTFYTGEKLMLRLVQEWLCDDSMRMSVSNVSMVCYKNEERFELQVNENSRHEALDNCVSFRERGCYLMVGALGGVGELICQELGRQYHAELIIFSRRERSLVEDSITRIEASGATVRYYSVDILDRAALEATMKLLQESGIELDGVIHMARQMTEGAFRDKTFESFIENISAKVMGSLNIDAVTAKESLDFFLIYNSMAAFGNRGLSDYSYAGAFQSAMIRHRNRKVAEGERSGRSLSICWGPWGIDNAVSLERLQQLKNWWGDMGMDFIDPNSSIMVMNLCLKSPNDVIGFIAVNDKESVLRALGFENFSANDRGILYSKIEAFENGIMSETEFARFLDTIEDSCYTESIKNKIIHAIYRADKKNDNRFKLIDTVSIEANHGEGRIEQSKQNKYMKESCSEELITGQVIRSLEKVLKLKKENLDWEKSFQNYGLDSISAMQLSIMLEKELKCSIPPNWFIECSNLNLFTNRLKQEFPKSVH